MAPYISLQDQKQIKVPIFPSSHLEIALRIEPLLDKISHNEFENKTMSLLRDTLLPKLLSGEVRVKDAERVAGEHI